MTPLTTLEPVEGLPAPVTVAPATAADHEPLRRLWPLFRHDVSAHTGTLPRPDGGYRSERLDAALADATWAAWLLRAGPHPIGFALARALGEPVRVLNSFFLVAPARRHGLGTAFARAVVGAVPGRWSVAFQDRNPAAAAFWPRLAAVAGTDRTLERAPVPGRPEVPPDTWLTFTSRPTW